jgi:hypothetical protein
MVMVRFWPECWEREKSLAALEMTDLLTVVPDPSAESILSRGVEELRINSEWDLTGPNPPLWQMSIT